MACHETPFRPTRGFTLIELVVALVVAAIVITVAVPVSNNIIERNMMTAARDRRIGVLSFARSESIQAKPDGHAVQKRGWGSVLPSHANDPEPSRPPPKWLPAAR